MTKAKTVDIQDWKIKPQASPVNLTFPDTSGCTVGRSKLAWGLWYFLGAPVLKSYFLPWSSLKVAVLCLFGAKMGNRVYLKPGVRVKFPWKLSVGSYSWIGEDVWIDNISEVSIGSHACISQGAYLCTGNHNWKSKNMKSFSRPITLQDGCWVGAQATICPGVTFGVGSIATVGSIVSCPIPAFQVWGGNPATYLRDRIFTD